MWLRSTVVGRIGMAAAVLGLQMTGEGGYRNDTPLTVVGAIVLGAGILTVRLNRRPEGDIEQ